MSKLIVASQRVDIHAAYGERRDALDQSWSALFGACGALLLPLPNDAHRLPLLLERILPDGILLTGGNTASAYGGDAPERDATDAALIAYAQEKRLPLLGVCRGMQSLVQFYGGVLQGAPGHVGQSHPLTGTLVREAVNSYHRFVAAAVQSPLEALATAPDGTIEAVRHSTLPMLGIMWHPERGAVPRDEDLALLRKQFCLEEGQ